MNELKTSVYNSLKFRIITQDLKPGESLNEKAVMEAYGIGKTPLREVFLNLQRDGLIRRFPRSGTIVSPIDFSDMRDASEIRVRLEGLVGELAARRISDAEIARFAEVLSRMEKTDPAGEMERVVTDDTELHNILYKAAGNPKLEAIIQELQSIYSRFWFSLQFETGDMEAHLAEWREILAALRARDGEETSRLLQQHILDFIHRVKDVIF